MTVHSGISSSSQLDPPSHRADVTLGSCSRSTGAEAEQDGCVSGSGELGIGGGGIVIDSGG